MSSVESQRVLSRDNNFSGSGQIAKRRKLMIDRLPVSDQRFQRIPEAVLSLVQLAGKTNGLAFAGRTGEALSPAEKTVLKNYDLRAISEVETGDILAIPLARPDAEEYNDVGFIHSANFLAARIFRSAQGVGSPVYCEKLAVRAPIEVEDEDTHELVAGIAGKFVVQDESVSHLIILSGEERLRVQLQMQQTEPTAEADDPETEKDGAFSGGKQPVLNGVLVTDFDGNLRVCSSKSEGTARMRVVGGMIRVMGANKVQRLCHDWKFDIVRVMELIRFHGGESDHLGTRVADDMFGMLRSRFRAVSNLVVVKDVNLMERFLTGQCRTGEMKSLSLLHFSRGEIPRTEFKDVTTVEAAIALASCLASWQIVAGALYDRCFLKVLTPMIDVLEDGEVTKWYYDVYLHWQCMRVFWGFYHYVFTVPTAPGAGGVDLGPTDMPRSNPKECAEWIHARAEEFAEGARAAAQSPVAAGDIWERLPHLQWSHVGGQQAAFLADPWARGAHVAKGSVPSKTEKGEPQAGSAAVKAKGAGNLRDLCPFFLAQQLGVKSSGGETASGCKKSNCKEIHPKGGAFTWDEADRAAKRVTSRALVWLQSGLRSALQDSFPRTKGSWRVTQNP